LKNITFEALADIFVVIAEDEGGFLEGKLPDMFFITQRERESEGKKWILET
jgi:hypothetical protein